MRADRASAEVFTSTLSITLRSTSQRLPRQRTPSAMARSSSVTEAGACRGAEGRAVGFCPHPGTPCPAAGIQKISMLAMARPTRITHGPITIKFNEQGTS